MNAPTPPTAGPRRWWLLGVGIPLFLMACATPWPEREGAIDIGYGEVDEEHVEGSVNTAEADDEGLERAQALADMLRRFPGVQVAVRGDDLVVRIRGGSSFLASEEPLFVVDGMEYRGSLRGINPSAIESITVLKNASETAVYGAKGANGVIIITTKGGVAAKGGVESGGAESGGA